MKFLLIILLPFFLFAQSSNWQTTKTLATSNISDDLDLFSNQSGNHIIMRVNNKLTYALYNYAGSQIRSVTIDSNKIR